MSSSNPEHNLTPAEVDDLRKLEDTARQHLATYVQVGNALAEIRDRHLYRDSHASFETYTSDRWGIKSVGGDALSPANAGADAAVASPTGLQASAPRRPKPCEALARACEQTLSALDADDRLGVEIRLVVRKPGDPDAAEDGQSSEPSDSAAPVGADLLLALRWLLTQASGTIGDVARQLEARAVDIDDHARGYLRDDVLVVEGELAVVKALLVELIDWDAELEKLLESKPPPADEDGEPGGGE